MNEREKKRNKTLISDAPPTKLLQLQLSEGYDLYSAAVNLLCAADLLLMNTATR